MVHSHKQQEVSQMKLQKKPKASPLKKILTPIVVLLLIVGGYLTYAATQAIWPFSHNPSEASDTTTPENNPSDTSNTPSDDTNSSPSSEESPSKTSTGNQSSTTNTLKVSITSAVQSGNTLKIRTQIDEPLTSGTCHLNLSDGNKTVSEHATLQTLPSTSTCKGFNIDTSKLTAGSWKINLYVTSDDSSGSATKSITIE